MFHGIQQDMDSKKDVFQTQNIGIKDIEAKGNVDIKLLQNLVAEHMHHPHHPHHPFGFHGKQQDHDSMHDLFQTQNIGIEDIKSAGNVDITLQNLVAEHMHHPHHPHHPFGFHGKQQDYDSKDDVFQTQNIGIKEIEAKGDVVIKLQNLMKHMHHHPHMFHGIQQDMDSKKDVFQTQNIGIKDIDSGKNVVIRLIWTNLLSNR